MSLTVSTGKPKGEAAPRKARPRWLTAAIELAIIATAVLMGVVIRTGLLESAMVVSNSMVPTLQKQERFLVDHRPGLHHNWQRGEVVLFDAPPDWPEGDDFVKRIIGMPGDTFEIKADGVYINGKLLKEEYLNEPPQYDAYGPVQLGATKYYMMGDNRNNSDDSRSHGAVDDQYLRGRVVLRYWPLGRLGRVGPPDY